jgi:hypothetical protein
MEPKRPDNNPKSAYGVRKPQLDKIPPAGLIHMGVVMGLGAAKYGPFNWRTNSVAASVYIGAAMRHLQEYLDGMNVEGESGASPLGHVMACCAILLDAESLGILIDDRPPAGAAHELIQRFTVPMAEEVFSGDITTIEGRVAYVPTDGERKYPEIE